MYSMQSMLYTSLIGIIIGHFVLVISQTQILLNSDKSIFPFSLIIPKNAIAGQTDASVVVRQTPSEGKYSQPMSLSQSTYFWASIATLSQYFLYEM